MQRFVVGCVVLFSLPLLAFSSSCPKAKFTTDEGMFVSLDFCNGVDAESLGPNCRSLPDSCVGVRILRDGDCVCVGVADGVWTQQAYNQIQTKFDDANHSSTITFECGEEDTKSCSVSHKQGEFKLLCPHPSACTTTPPSQPFTTGCKPLALNSTHHFDLSALHQDFVNNAIFLDGHYYSLSPCENVPPPAISPSTCAPNCTGYVVYGVSTCVCLGAEVGATWSYVDSSLLISYPRPDKTGSLAFELICHPTEQKPISAMMLQNNLFLVTWLTPSACALPSIRRFVPAPVEITTQPFPITGCNDITVGGFTYNLSSLQFDFIVRSPVPTTPNQTPPPLTWLFSLAVCSPVAVPLPFCDPGCAIYVTENLYCTCAGDASGAVGVVTADGLVITYPQSASGRTTSIELVCAKEQNVTVRWQDKKDVVFRWESPAGCANPVHSPQPLPSQTPQPLTECGVLPYNQYFFDLRPLHFDWVINLPDYQSSSSLFLSACEPVPPPVAHHCGDGFGSCVAYSVGMRDNTQCECLGELASVSWVVVDSGLDIIATKNGLQSFAIELRCSKTEQRPSSVDQQFKLVTWHTPAACILAYTPDPTPTPSPSSAQCGVIEVDGATYDLSGLSLDYVYRTKFSDSNVYTLSACEDVSMPSLSCEAGCVGYQVDYNNNCWCLGKTDSVVWEIGRAGLQARYTRGSQRQGIGSSMVIMFKCAHDEVKPNSVDEEKDHFVYNFVWQSPFACAQKRA